MKLLRKLVLVLAFLLFLPGLVKANESNFSLSWPLKGEVLVGFGEKGSEVKKHLGVDISSSPGSKILSPCSGKVVFVGKTPKFYPKYTVSIEVAEDIWTTLSPLEEVFVEKEGFVKEGEEVGILAQTGDSSSSPLPHLHWGLKIHSTSQYLNPLDYIEAEESLIDTEDLTSTLPLVVEGDEHSSGKENGEKSLSGEALRNTKETLPQKAALFSPSGSDVKNLYFEEKLQIDSEKKKSSPKEGELTTFPSPIKNKVNVEGSNQKKVARILWRKPLDKEVFVLRSEKAGEEKSPNSSLHSDKSLLKVSVFSLFISLFLSYFTLSFMKGERKEVCLG